METREGGRVYSEELEEALRSIPGRVIVLIDACNSGGHIGSESSFSEQFSAVFSHNSFASEKYLVIVSCHLDENSYRVSADKAIESSVATVFARSFCEGLGWDLINDHSTALKADADRNREVTFTELSDYVRRRCMYYLSAMPM